MKHNLFLTCIFLLLVLASVVFAEDGYIRCDSDLSKVNGKVFDDLTISFENCSSSDIMFENVTVTGDVIFDGIKNDYRVSFTGSSLNQVKFYCHNRLHCELGLDGTTTLNNLDLHPSSGGSITVNGLIPDSSPRPSFYEQGYLCEGQPEFVPYTNAETSIEPQMQDLETFADLGKIDNVSIYASDDSTVTFDNVWVYRVFTLPEKDHTPRNFTINSKGFAFIDLLDSGISFSLHNMNPVHLPSGSTLSCSYVAGDQMNIGLLLLYSDSDLTVSMDRHYIDYVVFFGKGCDQSTLMLDSYADSPHASDIFQVHVYDANAEFFTKSIQGVYFLITPDEAPYKRFYEYFDKAETLIRGHRSDFVDPEMLPYLPDEDSEYWNRTDAALVWSQLMPYYNITPSGIAADGVSSVYNRSETNIPYIYYHAAYIVKVRVLNAYGGSGGLLPDYITAKNWVSPNPFITGGEVRLCENGGCGFNHKMSMGTVSFPTSLCDITAE